MLAVLRAGRNVVRLIEIAFILARYDALFPLERIVGLRFAVRALGVVRRRDAALARLRPGQRLAAALQAMGPSFIKLGQGLSTRADLIGEAVATDLSSLQDRLPPFPATAARATIETELGQPVEVPYPLLQDTPAAAAAIPPEHLAGT